MANEPVLSGEIPNGGVLEVLREIEMRRITGKIRFVVGDESGEVELVAGQLAMDQDPLPDGSDPVEALLAARSGIYAVHSVLPPLPVSQGDEQERRGSLAVHVPADLMAYCEQAGLTGVLEMRNEGRVVEVVYEIGEMLGIRLDGREDADLGEVFAWDQGSFRIGARSQEDVRSRLPPPEVPVASARPPEPPEDPTEREPTVRWARPEPPARSEPSDGGSTSRYAKVDGNAPAAREDTGKQFLRVVEMALTDVVSVREKARASVRSQPPPKARPSVRPPPVRPARNKDSTVRIVWIGGEPSIEQEVPLAARTASKPEAAQAPPSASTAPGSAVAPVPVEHGAKHAVPAPPHDELAPAEAPKAARVPAESTASSEGAASSSLRVIAIVVGLAIVIAMAIYAIQP